MTWVAAGIASAAVTMAGIQYVKGKRDQKKDEKNRPNYQIPTEVGQNLTDAQRMALQGLPEEQKQEYISNLQRSQAYSLSELGTRKSGIAGLAALNQNTNDSYAKLLSMDAQAKIQNQGALMGERQNVANYKDQQWQTNTLNPYYENIARRQARDGALFKTLMNAGGFMGYGSMGNGSNANAAAGTQGAGTRMYTPSPSNETGMYNYNENSIQYNRNNGLYDYEGKKGTSYDPYGNQTMTG